MEVRVSEQAYASPISIKCKLFPRYWLVAWAIVCYKKRLSSEQPEYANLKQ